MRVIVISVLLFISVVVADEAGVAIYPAEEAGIGETIDSVKEEGISVAINPAEEAGIGETTNAMFNGESQTLGITYLFFQSLFLRKLYMIEEI